MSQQIDKLVEKKVKAIEYLDEKIIRPIVEGLEAAGEDFRMVILPDHPTPICIRTHSSKPVPFMIYDSRKDLKKEWRYNEREASASGNIVIEDGYKLMDRLIRE